MLSVTVVRGYFLSVMLIYLVRVLECYANLAGSCS